ncbi:GntR family transcriptional regulator [Nocardiopsis potens]|uniref:GntR family transcriptional regulator n=1 Tax=Nocardiopsis potens TaxID=1246458 RepID=UPI0003468156|nr:GntR family transcriptional regulator [Nocardiopsis potens]
MTASKKHDAADRLRAALDRGDHAPGDRLPRSAELAARFGVSAATVRAALRILQDEGRVSVRPGRGAFVRDYRPTLHLATDVQGARDSERFETGYAARLRELGHLSVTEEIKVGIEEMSPKVARRLGDPGPAGGAGAGPDGGTGALAVVRSCDRFVDGALWESQTSHLPYALAGDTELMSPERIARGVDQVLAELGHPRDWAWDAVGARMPAPAEAERFGLGPGVALLVQERTVYSGRTAVRFTETVMPADRHQLVYADPTAPGDLLLLAADVSIFET